MDLPEPDDLIDTTEAARLLKTRLVIVYRWILRGRLRGWKRAGRYFVSKTECLAMFKPVTHKPILPNIERGSGKPTRKQQRQAAAYDRWTEDVLRRSGIIRDGDGAPPAA